MPNCPHCHKLHHPLARFCSDSGQRLPDVRPAVSSAVRRPSRLALVARAAAAPSWPVASIAPRPTVDASSLFPSAPASAWSESFAELVTVDDAPAVLIVASWPRVGDPSAASFMLVEPPESAFPYVGMSQIDGVLVYLTEREIFARDVLNPNHRRDSWTDLVLASSTPGAPAPLSVGRFVAPPELLTLPAVIPPPVGGGVQPAVRGQPEEAAGVALRLGSHALAVLIERDEDRAVQFGLIDPACRYFRKPGAGPNRLAIPRMVKLLDPTARGASTWTVSLTPPLDLAVPAPAEPAEDHDPFNFRSGRSQDSGADWAVKADGPGAAVVFGRGRVAYITPDPSSAPERWTTVYTDPAVLIGGRRQPLRLTPSYTVSGPVWQEAAPRRSFIAWASIDGEFAHYRLAPSNARAPVYGFSKVDILIGSRFSFIDGGMLATRLGPNRQQVLVEYKGAMFRPTGRQADISHEEIIVSNPFGAEGFRAVVVRVGETLQVQGRTSDYGVLPGVDLGAADLIAGPKPVLADGAQTFGLLLFRRTATPPTLEAVLIGAQ